MLRMILTVVLLAAIAAVAGIAWLSWRFSGTIAADVERLVAGAGRSDTVVTEDMLRGLPPPAQRYLAHAGVVGKTVPAIVRLRQTGRIRSAADAAWMDLTAEETYSTDPPAFVWRAWFPRQSMPLVFGRDLYLDGAGSILMKALGVFPLADESGGELAAAGLMRYLNEMVWFPAALLGANVAIAPLDDDRFVVTISDRGTSATATLYVDGEGRLTNFSARRFNTATQSLETWETPFAAYGTFEGIRMPSKGSAVWRLAGGDFTYIELEVTEVAYDRPLP